MYIHNNPQLTAYHTMQTEQKRLLTKERLERYHNTLDRVEKQMLEDYNKEFEYEEVGYCKPDGDDNQAWTAYYPMWTGWKVDAYDTYSHDNGACAANYWGNPTWGKEKFTEDRHHNRHRGDSCSNVEDKYEAECEYGLVMGSYDDYDWHTEALWYTRAYGEKSSYIYEERVCGCEKASLASGDCSANASGHG